MTQVELSLRPQDMRPAGGLCWTIRLPDNIASGDTADRPTRSSSRAVVKAPAPSAQRMPIIPVSAASGAACFRTGIIISTFLPRTAAIPGRAADAYAVTSSAATGAEDEDTPAAAENPTLFPRLAAIGDAVRRDNHFGSMDLLYNPEGDLPDRVKMLEAKVEYLLDELYTAKSFLRYLLPNSMIFAKA